MIHEEVEYNQIEARILRQRIERTAEPSVKNHFVPALAEAWYPH